MGLKVGRIPLKIINGSVIAFTVVIGLEAPTLASGKLILGPSGLSRFGKFNEEHMLSKCQAHVLFQIEWEVPKALNI